MKQTFGVAFYCRESKRTKNGSPIEMSLSINCERTFIALPRRLEPKDFAKDMASKRSNPTKDFCKEYERAVDEAVQQLLQRRRPITSKAIKSIILHTSEESTMFSSISKEYLDLIKLKDTTIGTYRKYEMAFERFIKQTNDKDINDVTNLDIQTYIADCTREYGQGTVRSYTLKLKSVFIFARQNGKLTNDPWASIKVKNHQPKIETITEEEYKKIASKKFDIPRLERARKIFILACNSGLAYCDIQALAPSDIQHKDGIVFVEKERLKTGVTFTAVFQEDGKKILDEMGDNFDELKISNQKINSYLKEIADHNGITKNLTFHKARHYAITHLMRIGISPQIVQRCAGHTKLSMTQRYTHLLQDDILNAFKG